LITITAINNLKHLKVT